MKKQFVLEESEYYSICNTLEHLQTDIILLNRQLSENEKNEVRERLVAITKRIEKAHKLLGWK